MGWEFGSGWVWVNVSVGVGWWLGEAWDDGERRKGKRRRNLFGGLAELSLASSRI